jgi:uncharacterized protein (TIGR02996 family)
VSDRELFLRAIEAEPDSDVPRLVFSDWLDEHGDAERAEFIRAQCESYRIRYGPPSRGDDRISAAEMARMQELTRRAAQLLDRCRRAWTAGLPDWALYVGFQRGFQDFYYFTGKQLLEDGAAIRRIAPLAGYLSLRLSSERAAKVFNCPHLALITKLDLDRCRLKDAAIKHLGASRYLGMVKELNLKWNRLTDAAAATLAEAENMPMLRRLCLNGNASLTSAGVQALVESPLRSGITHLEIASGPGGSSVAEVFRTSRFKLTGLISLDLGGRPLGDAGAAILAHRPYLACLRQLGLQNCDISDEAAKAIITSRLLQKLRGVNFSYNPAITDATAQLILSDPRDWESVRLHGTAISELLLREVAKRCERK